MEVVTGVSEADAVPELAATEPAAANGSTDVHDDGLAAMPSPKEQPESAGQPGDHAEQMPSPLGDSSRAGSAARPPRAEPMAAPPPRAAARPQAPPPQFHQPPAPLQAAGGLELVLLSDNPHVCHHSAAIANLPPRFVQATRLGRRLQRRQQRQLQKRCLHSVSAQLPKQRRRCVCRMQHPAPKQRLTVFQHDIHGCQHPLTTCS